MPPEYAPGKCNIGARGRAIRLATGLGIVAVFVGFGLLTVGSVSLVFRLFLFIPFYVGLLAILEGTMSFCVLHASRGTYDLHEPSGMAFGKSTTKMTVGSDEWKKLDRRKAKVMHLEAVLGALVLAGLLALA
ncbi:hypothetical protein E6H33_10315 [Candidatus Bathyarchaeota archaeon]|nr:MAG: hypothetical protein E6H33_10315 [Candidatus Bathyarchaeota archaeon]